MFDIVPLAMSFFSSVRKKEKKQTITFIHPQLCINNQSCGEHKTSIRNSPCSEELRYCVRYCFMLRANVGPELFHGLSQWFIS